MSAVANTGGTGGWINTARDTWPTEEGYGARIQDALSVTNAVPLCVNICVTTAEHDGANQGETSPTQIYKSNQRQVDSIQSTNGIAISCQCDFLGRVTQCTQSIDGFNHTTSYTYNDLARTATITLPSGIIVKTI